MPQSLAPVFLHIVFSTKNRFPFLADRVLRAEMHTYLAGALEKLSCIPYRVGGVEDHVHIACKLSRCRTISEIVLGLKKTSSKWVKNLSRVTSNFHWQGGYGAFSISPGHLKPLLAYIDNQEDHHRDEPFQDEMRRLLKSYDATFDERYVWD